MNALIIASWYPSKINNVNGVFIREHAVALSKAGINVTVFFPYDKSLQKDEFIETIEDGILTYRANTDYLRNTKLSRINSILKCMKLIDILVKKHGIDIIHSHVCYSAGFAAAFYKKKHRLPFVITEHMSYISKYSTKFYNRMLFKFAYESADMVMPVSSALEKEMRGMGYSFKSNVVGNVVNTQPLDFKKAENNKNEYNALFIGLMSKNRIKGIEHLIPALEGFIKSNPDCRIRLHFAGDGELKDEYIKMCKDRGLEDSAIFHGRVEKQVLRKLIIDSDFLIVSSIKETFGSVLIEAMAEGIPVLSTRCGGPEDFVNERVGILVEPGSADALKAGIKEMIENLGKFDPVYIKKYAYDNFSGESIGNKYKKIYEDIFADL